MQAAVDELHERVYSEPSPVADCINTPVSFDSSWKTRGFYSNVGFGPLFLPSTRRFWTLFYSIALANCVVAGPQSDKNNTVKIMTSGTPPTRPIVGRTSANPANLWSRKQLKLFGGDLLRNVSCVTRHLSEMRTRNLTAKYPP